MSLSRNKGIRGKSHLAICIGLGIWTLNGACASEPAAPTVLKISLDDLAATRDRPLFSPSRRPPPSNVAVAIAPPPPPPPPQVPIPVPNLTFYGTYESPTEVWASVQLSPDDKPINVRYGTIIGGWRVIDISRQRMVLALGDRKAEFKLFNTPATATPSAPLTDVPSQTTAPGPPIQPRGTLPVGPAIRPAR